MNDDDKTTLLPETECPQCSGQLSWKLVRNAWGSPTVNGRCATCNIILYGREAPEVTRGKKLEATGETKGIPAMDDQITSLPLDVQLGILRQRQHKN